MLVIVAGMPGTGKTHFIMYSMMAALKGGVNLFLRRRYRTTYDVRANFATFICHSPRMKIDRTGLATYMASCKCPGAQPGGTLDPLKLVDDAHEFPDYQFIALHEMGMWCDSRLTASLTGYMKKRRLLLTYLNNQRRKAHLDMFVDTQFTGQLDNRLREYPDYLVRCRNFGEDPEHDELVPMIEVWDHPDTTRYLPEPSYTYSPVWFLNNHKFYQKYLSLMTFYNTWEKPPWRTEVEEADRVAELEVKT